MYAIIVRGIIGIAVPIMMSHLFFSVSSISLSNY